MDKRTIYICGLILDANLGDPIIFKATHAMINEIVGGNCRIDIKGIDFYVRDRIGFSPVLKKIRDDKDYPCFNSSEERRRWKASILCENICNIFIDDTPLCIIFSGGGLIKYKYQNFDIYIDKITEFAEERNIPVMFNAVGVEGFDETNKSCLTIKKALNRNCVKIITVRDDIETLLKKYEYKGFAYQVADPACSISKYYSFKKDNNNIIGINCSRPGLFTEYDTLIDANSMLKLMISIIKLLNKNGYCVELFCNGTVQDYAFMDEIYNCSQSMDVRKTKRPETELEFLQMMNHYSAVIASRLHASIVAYSYEIPFVSLMWNRKQRFFCESINKEDWCIESKNFNAVFIVERLFEAIKTGYDKDYLSSYTQDTKRWLKEFINKFVMI